MRIVERDAMNVIPAKPKHIRWLVNWSNSREHKQAGEVIFFFQSRIDEFEYFSFYIGLLYNKVEIIN